MEQQERNKLILFASGLSICFTNGFIYSYPIYSSVLRYDFQLTSSQIVLLGVGSQAGLGIVNGLLSRLYSSSIWSVKLSMNAEAIDRLWSLSCASMAMLSLFGIGSLHYDFIKDQNKDKGNEYYFGILMVFFITYGIYVGTSFVHVSTVVNFVFNDDPRKKSFVASCSLAVGIGGVIVVPLEHILVLRQGLPLNIIFFSLGTVVALVSLFRFFILVRFKTDRNHQPAYHLARTQSTNEQKTPPMNGSVLHAINEQVESQAIDVEPNRVVPTVNQTQISSDQVNLKAYLKSAPVWLLCTSTFFGIGISSTYLSSLGNLSEIIVSTSYESTNGTSDEAVLVARRAEALQFTFVLTMLFLSCQAFARLLTTLLYGKYSRTGYMSALWQVVNFFGICSYVIAPTRTGAIISRFVLSNFDEILFFHSKLCLLFP